MGSSHQSTPPETEINVGGKQRLIRGEQKPAGPD
jgi:hypothetical protein